MLLPITPDLALIQRQLIGAYFLHEYSFEAAALFNPSIVAHPDQSGAPEGGLRFILSLRAVGEGHVSSLTFRTGSIAANGDVIVDPTSRIATTPSIRIRRFGIRRQRGQRGRTDLSRPTAISANG